MTDADGPDSGSPAQMGWREIAEAVRAALAQKVRELPTMNAQDCHYLVAACWNALCLEQQATLFDHHTENEMAKGPHD